MIARLLRALLLLPALAHAGVTLPGDVTGIWQDERHPGWGLGLVQENDAVFATLFAYDASGAPVWLVASRLEANGVNFDPCGTMPLTGALYRTQWPTFGSAANPAGNPQVQSVGTITVSVATAATQSCDRNRVAVQYFVDGVQTALTLTRLTWANNQARFYGQYVGGMTFGAPTGSCPDLPATIVPAAFRQFAFTVAADPSGGGVNIVWGLGIDTACQVLGTYSQSGQFGAVSGTITCSPIGFVAPPLATFRLAGLQVTEAGVLGEASLDTDACHYRGSFAGARRP